MIRIAAVSDAYVEPFTRVGLFTPSSAEDFNISVILPEIAAKKSAKGFELLKREFPDIRLLKTYLNFHHSVRFYSARFSSVIRKIRPDILFINNEPWSSTAYQAVMAALSCAPRPKILVYTSENRHRRFLPPFNYFERTVLANADLVLTVTKEEGKKVLVQKGYRGRTSYLPLSVDTNIFKKTGGSQLREQLAGNDENVFLLGYAGRIIKDKGIQVVLKSLPKCGNTIFAVLGSGPYRNELSRTADKLGLSGRVRFIDSVFHDALPGYLNSFDALVLPSLTTRTCYEQFGRILIEAMACEIPVIGSDSGEIPQVIGDAGLVFRENDPASLADAVLKLKNDRAAAKAFAEKGRKRVLELFSRDVLNRRTEEMYRKVINESIV